MSEPDLTASRCQAESLDGHEHSEDVTEFVGICVRGHERRGLVCGACARPLRDRGPAVVTCAECPEGDPRRRVLMLAKSGTSTGWRPGRTIGELLRLRP